MERQKQQWIDECMQSLDGIQRAQAPATFTGKLNERIRTRKIIGIEKFSLNEMLRVAAAVTLLIGLNIYTVTMFAHGEQSSRNENLKSLATEFSDSNDNYNY